MYDPRGHHPRRRRPATLLAAILVVMAGPPASAHGVFAHIHVTAWAIESLPPGPLRELLLDDPEVLDAALFGAVFTDSGYAAQGEIAGAARAFAEHTHWEPFVQDYIEWIAEHDPPPWSAVESRRRVAFLLGCAAHGMQDEVFDSLFLPQVEEHDGGSQDDADPAMDGFLALDGKLEQFPTPWTPAETLVELYSGLAEDVTTEVIQDSVDLLVAAYVNETLGPVIAETLGEEHEASLPWARQHYLDPAIPGSLASEVPATARYIEAIWERLHEGAQPAQAVVHTFPESGQLLLGSVASSPDSWVTLVYGIGLDADAAVLSFTNLSGAKVAFETMGTRWGAEWTRLHRLAPNADLDPGARYAVELEPGVPLIDGRKTDAKFRLELRAPCLLEPGDAACAPPAQPRGDDAAAPGGAEAPAAAEGAGDPEAQAPQAGGDGGGSSCSADGPPGAPLPVLALLLLLWLARTRRPKPMGSPSRGARRIY